jgi:glycosyltransferase involved in cell wall biosynthesis
MAIKVSFVIPCFNEEAVIPITVTELLNLLEECKKEELTGPINEIVLVDDGSKDQTWLRILEAAKNHPSVKGIRLSQNRGHQNALLAGLQEASGDFIISMDCDLQDDPYCVKDMLRDALNGSDIVFGVRKSRKVDSYFTLLTAGSFYKIMHILGVNTITNHADYRGMSRKAVEALLQFREVNLFLRGMVTQLGFKTSIVYFDRKERVAGAPSYTLSKRIGLAWQGITSCSVIPLRIATFIGLFFSGMSFLLSIWVLISYFAGLASVPGWASTILPISFFSGVQLLSLGVIGEYLGKIYLETKARPRYFISEKTDDLNITNIDN